MNIGTVRCDCILRGCVYESESSIVAIAGTCIVQVIEEIASVETIHGRSIRVQSVIQLGNHVSVVLGISYICSNCFTYLP